MHKAIGLLTVRWGEQGAVLAWAGGEGGVGGCRPDARPCQGLWGAVCAPGEGSGKEPRGPRSTATGGGRGRGGGRTLPALQGWMWSAVFKLQF